MNREQIDNNRQRVVQELTATGVPGIEAVVAMMDKGGFFTAKCQRHDDSEGGMANHSLWILDFARRISGSQLARNTRPAKPSRTKAAAASQAAAAIAATDTEARLTIAALCHYVRGAVDKLGLVISDELLRTVEDAVQRSIEYADGIPFGTEATAPFKAGKADAYIDIIFDQDEHVMWSGSEGHEGVFLGTETLCSFPVHHVMTVPVRPDASGNDILVMYDDSSMYSLMFLSEEGGRGTCDMHRSDKVMFGYRELVFFITRYPQHRSSYIACLNAKGLWGVLRIRENRKNNSDHKLLVERVVDHKWRSASKAVSHMTGHSGCLISVQDTEFYSRIEIPSF